MGFADIRYDAMGNLIASYGAGTSGKSLMFIGNAMNQLASTMPNPYDGDVVDGAKFDLPGECVMGKGASEQKANLAAMLHAMETVIASKVPIVGKLIFTCCLSGDDRQARRHQERGRGRGRARRHGGAGRHRPQDPARQPRPHRRVRDREGSPCHSSRPWDGVNAVTGATEAIRLLLGKVKLDNSHPQLGKQSLTVNHIRSFPRFAHRAGALRVRSIGACCPARTPNEAFAEIERIAKEVERLKDPVSGKAYGVEVRLGPFMYPSLVTRMEVAAGRRVERGGDLALDGREALLARLEPRHLGEQRLGVGVVRARESAVGRRDLDHAAEIHDHDAVGDVLHHAEVVADEQVGEAELLAQLHEQVEHLRLDRDVERRDRLVADEELRLHRERPGDADAGALAAGELVRVAAA